MLLIHQWIFVSGVDRETERGTGRALHPPVWKVVVIHPAEVLNFGFILQDGSEVASH